MFYVSLYLVNHDGRSNKRYTFHTESTVILAGDTFLCETQHGIVVGNNPVIADMPDFETKRAVRITEGIFEQARMNENINKGK